MYPFFQIFSKVNDADNLCICFKLIDILVDDSTLMKYHLQTQQPYNIIGLVAALLDLCC